MAPYIAYILIKNFESTSKKLGFDKFSIIRVDSRNWEEIKKIFSPIPVYKTGQHYIERRYEKVPPLYSDADDVSGFGRIPYYSEDLMFLLRLYKVGDIVFEAQVIKDPDNNISHQYQYPVAFSNYHSPCHYKMSEEDVIKFNKFLEEVSECPGWNSECFKITRRYFLWGGSKEFFPGRDNERILDYMIALEAAFVPETDFVTRRLRERTAAILSRKDKEKSIFKKRIDNFYRIRSFLAHGNPLSSKQIKILEEESSFFENDIRQLLRHILKAFPPNKNGRKEYLCKLGDISDEEKGDKIIEDFRRIKDKAVRKKAIKSVSGETGDTNLKDPK
jgi:hypothetical protein